MKNKQITTITAENNLKMHHELWKFIKSTIDLLDIVSVIS